MFKSSCHAKRILRFQTHCPGLPNTCGSPGPNDAVFYRWPADIDGSNRYVRHSALQAKDTIFTLPFASDSQVDKHNGWLYSPGSWHHAIDFMRSDWGTFKVLATAPGRVIHIGWDWWGGNTIIVSHDAGGITDADRTIYMHLRNGKDNDCKIAWSTTVPILEGRSDLIKEKNEYKEHLNTTSCPLIVSERNPNEDHWGTNQQKIGSGLLGKQVDRGSFLAWAGNTGPGGKRGSGGPNTHLHLFFTRRDPSNNEWYFIDPWGIYGPPGWKGGKPQYP